MEDVQLNTQNGTNSDAPYHFASIMDGGQPPLTIDEVDLNWCFQPGEKLDLGALPEGYIVQPADVEAELKRIGPVPKPPDIVPANTHAGQAHGMPESTRDGCGMGPEATLYLLERGVRLSGTDAWRREAPFAHTAKKFPQTKDASLIWEGLKAGRSIGYCDSEKLHNLHRLSPHGYFVSCFPVKIRRASAGSTRALAIFDDLLQASGWRECFLFAQRTAGMIVEDLAALSE